MTRTCGASLRIAILLVCLSAFALVASAQCPNCVTLNLPPGPVSATVNYNLSTSLYSTTLSGIPDGYDVMNATYAGWCADRPLSTVFAAQTPGLYSTYGALPSNIQSPNWDKVNWVLNNKPIDAGWLDIQQVIWMLLRGTFDSEYGSAMSPVAQNLLAAAQAQGGGFVPVSGQVVAVLLYQNGFDSLTSTRHQNQDTIIEVPTYAIGDYVWLDQNADGKQGPSEVGLDGITVQLEDLSNGRKFYAVTGPLQQPNGTLVHGYYLFTSLHAGQFNVSIDLAQKTIQDGLLTPTATLVGAADLDSNTNPAPVTLTAEKQIDLTIDFGFVGPPPLQLPCPELSGGEVDVPLNIQFHAAGGFPPYLYAFAGQPPAGLNLDSATGLLTGRPSAPGSFAVQVTDAKNVVATVACPIVIVPPPSMTCSPAGPGVAGVGFNSPGMTVTGGTAPYTFSVATGAIPAGLSLDASTGAVSGTPTAAGSFTLKVTDKNGVTATGACPFIIEPAPTATCVSIAAVQGVAITPVTMIGSGGAGGPYTFTAKGLPTGLVMSTDGTISGTPAAGGTFAYAVTVVDVRGNIGTFNCSVTVGSPANACGLTWGYWKNHVSLWPVISIGIGSQSYTREEIQAILAMAVKGDQSIELAHQLIAAKFNVFNGTDVATANGAIAAADQLLSGFSGKLPYSVAASSTLGQRMVAVASKLNTFNQDGKGQPGCGAPAGH